MSIVHPPDALSPGDRGGIASQLAGHPFCSGFDAHHIESLTAFTGTVEIPQGGFVFRHGQPADSLYLILQGDVTLEVAPAGTSPLILESLHSGDTLGWSWLYPPYQWQVDARATSHVTALTIAAPALRDRLAVDPVFGRDITHRVGQLVVDRLHHARSQLASVRFP